MASLILVKLDRRLAAALAALLFPMLGRRSRTTSWLPIRPVLEDKGIVFKG
ncbi:hypothetical protein CSPAE12_10093 [Colletotrichum incanum]|nr:hypothetical protein CSPAE12_10093 [Colletotrichum incanum]